MTKKNKQNKSGIKDEEYVKRFINKKRIQNQILEKMIIKINQSKESKGTEDEISI